MFAPPSLPERLAGRGAAALEEGAGKAESSGLEFVPPAWAAADGGAWTLEVIQHGDIAHSQEIGGAGRSFCTIGRAPAADMPGSPSPCGHMGVGSPSVSRLHAVLLHGKSGALWVADLGSTHGARLNKRRLVAGQFVRAAPGSVLEIGQSTRRIVLTAPPGLEEAAAQEPAQPKAAQPRKPEQRGAAGGSQHAGQAGGSLASTPAGAPGAPAGASGAPAASPSAAEAQPSDVPDVEEEEALALRREMLAVMGAGTGHGVTADDVAALRRVDGLLAAARRARKEEVSAAIRGAGRQRKGAAGSVSELEDAARRAVRKLRRQMGLGGGPGDGALLDGDLGGPVGSQTGPGSARKDGAAASALDVDNVDSTAAFRSIDVEELHGRDWDDDGDDDGETGGGGRGSGALGVRRQRVATVAPALRPGGGRGAAGPRLPALLQGRAGAAGDAATRLSKLARRGRAAKRPRQSGSGDAPDGDGIEDEASLDRKLQAAHDEQARAEREAAAIEADACRLEAALAEVAPGGMEAAIAGVQAAERRSEAAAARRRVELAREAADVARWTRLWRVVTGREWAPRASEDASTEAGRADAAEAAAAPPRSAADAAGGGPSSAGSPGTLASPAAGGPAVPGRQAVAREDPPSRAVATETAEPASKRIAPEVSGSGAPAAGPEGQAAPQPPAEEAMAQKQRAAAALASVRAMAAAARAAKARAARDATAQESGERDPDLRARQRA